MKQSISNKRNKVMKLAESSQMTDEEYRTNQLNISPMMIPEEFNTNLIE